MCTLSCDAFIELAYKNQTKKSVVVKNSQNPDWQPEEVFEFDLSKGEIVDLMIALKDWNRLTAIKDLGYLTIGVDKIKEVLSGAPGPRLGDGMRERDVLVCLCLCVHTR